MLQPVPTVLADPVPVTEDAERAADAAEQRDRPAEPRSVGVRDARDEEALDDFARGRREQHRGHDHAREHERDGEAHEALEEAEATAPDQQSTDRAVHAAEDDLAALRRLEDREERVGRDAARAHQRRSDPRGPGQHVEQQEGDVDRLPELVHRTLEQGAARRQLIARETFRERELQDAAEHDGPQDRRSQVTPREARRHQVAGPDARRRDEQPGADDRDPAR